MVHLIAVAACTGSGAYSVVRKGMRKSDRLIVAVKCIQRHRLSHTEMDNLRREIDIMRELKHDHVLSLLDVFADEAKEIHLVTQFVEGGELFDRILAKSSYKESEARRVVLQLLETLTYIHSKGVVHRDIKPEKCAAEQAQLLLLHRSSYRALVTFSLFHPRLRVSFFSFLALPKHFTHGQR